MRASVKVHTNSEAASPFSSFRVFSDNKLYPQGGVRPCPLLQEPFIYPGNGIRSIRFVHLKKSKKGGVVVVVYEVGDVFRMG